MREKSVLIGGPSRTETEQARAASFPALALVAVAVLGAAMGCTSFYEVPIEVPIDAKLDVSE
jgi:hypothetical protein